MAVYEMRKAVEFMRITRTQLKAKRGVDPGDLPIRYDLSRTSYAQLTGYLDDILTLAGEIEEILHE